MSSTLNNVHSLLVSVLRGGRGVFVRPQNRKNPPRPEQLLELYELERCPYCRKVREVLSELDLEYIVRTSGKGAHENRARIQELGGKTGVPFLVDPNTNTQMFESEKILDYLYATYGTERGALARMLAPANTTFSGAASSVRARGAKVRKGLETREQPAQLLELYNFEASPYCRKVREALCELNLDYIARNVAKGSARRPEFLARSGKIMVPYLIDPNTNTEMFESDDIVRYLEKTYGPGAGAA